MFRQTRVLIVEDNPVNFMIMRNQVRKHGIEPSLCTNGQEAVDYCRANPMPELILLDGYMPQMDGIQFLRWLRAQPNGAIPYVLFCSSSIDVVDVAEAMRLGADKHHPKPIAADDLAAALMQASMRAATQAKARTQS
jgi:CheY-like chemotaxis protein